MSAADRRVPEGRVEPGTGRARAPMGWLGKLSAAWRWWSEQCAKYDRRYDTLKAERVLMVMAAQQARQPAVLAFSMDALANLVGAAPGDLPPILASLERDAIVFRDHVTGRYSLVPMPWLRAPEGSRGRGPSRIAQHETSTA